MTLPLVLVALLAAGGSRGAAGIRWEHQFDEALKKARAQHKPLMVDFWADWCTWCHQLDETTYVDAVVVRMAGDFVAVKVDAEGGPRHAAVALRYDVSSLPTIAFLSPSGRQVLRLNGFLGPGQFPSAMKAAKEIARDVMSWEDALERNPRDAAALASLGVHLFDQESYDESRDLLERASKVDANRPVEERKRTRLLLGMMQKIDHHFSEAEAVLKEGLALQPAGEDDPKMLFVLGKTYIASGRRDEAVRLLQEILTAHPQSSVAERARETLVALSAQKR